jgi:hypothetical protein
MVRARSLAALVKARGFGMTPFILEAKLTHYLLVRPESHDFDGCGMADGGCEFGVARQ